MPSINAKNIWHAIGHLVKNPAHALNIFEQVCTHKNFEKHKWPFPISKKFVLVTITKIDQQTYIWINLKFFFGKSFCELRYLRKYTLFMNCIDMVTFKEIKFLLLMTYAFNTRQMSAAYYLHRLLVNPYQELGGYRGWREVWLRIFWNHKCPKRVNFL